MTPRARQHSVVRTAHGFTLLEAIVALVLLTTAGLALFSWMNASFDGLNRIEQSNARAAAELNALEFMKTVNPMERPEGQIKLGEIHLNWRSRPLQSPVANRNDAREPGPFMVALYETEVTLESAPKLAAYTISLRHFGYKRTGADLDVFGDPVSRNPSARSTGTAGRR